MERSVAILFSERLRKSFEGRSIRGFARECGLSEGVLRSYLRGDTFPTLDRLWAISAAAGVSVTWLATGESPGSQGGASLIQETPCEYRSLNEQLIGDVIEEVEVCLREGGLDLPPKKKRELVLTAYGLFASGGKVERETVVRLIRLAS